MFYPYTIRYTDGSVHLVVPPIVEERDGALFLGDGMHRFYCALALNIETAYVLVTHKCELPFPGVPQVWENISEAPKQLPVQCNFDVSRDYHKKCMMERNKFMVNHADILLAVCREIPRSGTEATINYARKMSREIIIIDPSAQRLTHENPVDDLSSI